MGWLIGWWIVFGTARSAVGVPSLQEGPCREFYAALDEVPHLVLTSREESIEAIWAGERVACEVSFETTDSTLAGAAPPEFLAEPGSEMYRAGWRMIPEIIADGPGSGLYGIQRSGIRCVVDWSQPAYIDDDGTVVQSDTLRMRVQCNGGGRP